MTGAGEGRGPRLGDAVLVDPNALDVFAARLGDLAEQVSEATAYLEDHLSIGTADGRIFLSVAPTVSAVRTLLVDNAAAIGRLVAVSGEEIARTAEQYRATDSTNATALDRVY
ncbi:type VII secretion target [Rhodococcus sp. BE178]|uniref:type VII secretion target n=1 Tax=Rhodococcus sp. BE178 TaxID=2817737 RepID=UPI003D23B39B